MLTPEELAKMKKAELVELCEELDVLHEGLKADDIRAEITKYYDRNWSICHDCVWYKEDVELKKHNIPSMPGDRGNVCKYYRAQLLAMPKVCEDHNPGGIGKTADAKINERKRKSIGE